MPIDDMKVPEEVSIIGSQSRSCGVRIPTPTSGTFSTAGLSVMLKPSLRSRGKIGVGKRPAGFGRTFYREIPGYKTCCDVATILSRIVGSYLCFVTCKPAFRQYVLHVWITICKVRFLTHIIKSESAIAL